MFLSLLGLVLHLQAAIVSLRVQPVILLLIFPTQHIFFHKFYYQTLHIQKIEIIVISKNNVYCIQTWQINRKLCFLTKYLLDDNDENFIDVSCLIAKGFTNRGH